MPSIDYSHYHSDRFSGPAEQSVSSVGLFVQMITFLGNDLQGGPQKRGHRLVTIILSVLNRFKNFFSLEDSLVNLQLKDIKIPPHLAYVATLPYETLMSAKQAINDKLHSNSYIFKVWRGCK